LGSYVDKNQLFIERREQGDYAVIKPESERASAVLPTQAEAIAWAKEHNPKATPMIKRVRNTATGISGERKLASRAQLNSHLALRRLLHVGRGFAISKFKNCAPHDFGQKYGAFEKSDSKNLL
jgi:hypothetical protein